MLSITDLVTNDAVHPDIQSLIDITRDPANNDPFLISALSPFFPYTQSIYMQNESALESHWAEKIIHSENPKKTLYDFPYIDKYQQICDNEENIIQIYAPEAKNILIVGSGPCPITALLYSEKYTITLLNRDESALNTSKDLNKALQKTNMRYCLSDIKEASNISDHDVILFGVSVGNAEQKKELLEEICKNMKPDSILLARTSPGLRQLLYPSITESDIPYNAIYIGTHRSHPRTTSACIVLKKV